MAEKKFMDRVVAGEIPNLDVAIDRYVSEWHTSSELRAESLPEYLGMTRAEYSMFVELSQGLQFVIEVRRYREILDAAIAWQEQGSRSRWKTKESLRLWDTVERLKQYQVRDCNECAEKS